MSQWNTVTVRLTPERLPPELQRWLEDHETAIHRRERFEASLVVLVDLQRLATRYETSDREPLEAFLSTLPVHALDDPRASYVQTDDTTDGGYGELYDLADGVVLVDDVAGEPTKCAQDVREYFRVEHDFEPFTSYEVFLGTE